MSKGLFDAIRISASGLRGQRSQTLSATQDPISVPYLSYLGGAESRAMQQEQFRAQNPEPGTAASPYDVFGRLKKGRGDGRQNVNIY